ncbi:hypothetical protein HI031_07315 [Staphylococcus haemolyticus]|nr:hypothetical protein HI031_07315 [Staphylococcus haemolyticus]
MTKNRCSVKVFIQTNVLEVKVYHNAQMEQTYEITDHTISKKAIIKDDNKNVNTTNGEQNNYKVFAFVR